MSDLNCTFAQISLTWLVMLRAPSVRLGQLGTTMTSAQPMQHHPAVSDDILLDTGARDPMFEEIYPRLPDFKLGVTHSWTRGQPFDFYRRMREEAPVMWSQIRKPSSGFWSVVRYDDVKHVELNPQIFFFFCC